MNKAILVLLFIIFLFVPVNAMAVNYGEGIYNSGAYNFGEPTPTPTPSPTPTPTSDQNNNNNSSSSSSGSSTSTPSCNDTAPGTPKLFQIDVKNNSAKLFFTPLPDTNKFYISYSTKNTAEEHGVEATLAKEGVQNFTVNALKANTNYYFKVRGQNGCMPGKWSNIVSVKTSSGGFFRTISYYMNSAVSQITSGIYKPKSPESAVVSKPVQTTTVSPTIPTQEVVAETVKNSKKKTCFLWWCW